MIRASDGRCGRPSPWSRWKRRYEYGERAGQLHRNAISRIENDAVSYKSGVLTETLHEPVVHIADDIAVVWADYEVRLDDQVQQCGTDVITLAKSSGRWIIIGLADDVRGRCGDQPG